MLNVEWLKVVDVVNSAAGSESAYPASNIWSTHNQPELESFTNMSGWFETVRCIFSLIRALLFRYTELYFLTGWFYRIWIWCCRPRLWITSAAPQKYEFLPGSRHWCQEPWRVDTVWTRAIQDLSGFWILVGIYRKNKKWIM